MRRSGSGLQHHLVGGLGVEGLLGARVWSLMGDTGKASGAPESPDGSVPKALDVLYHAHYRSLVRLAALLTGDALLAEELAADSLVALLSGPLGVRVQERAQFRLRQQVLARSRRVAHNHQALAADQPSGQQTEVRNPIS